MLYSFKGIAGPIWKTDDLVDNTHIGILQMHDIFVFLEQKSIVQPKSTQMQIKILTPTGKIGWIIDSSKFDDLAKALT